MAKKTVATLKTGDGRGYAKVIKMVKSPKTGAYMFKEQMVTTDPVSYTHLDVYKRQGLQKLWGLLLHSICLPGRY